MNVLWQEANHKINRTHKRALRILHNGYDSSFNTLLKKSDTVTLHIKNLQKLMLEIYKSMNHLSPSYITKEIQYDLRTKHLCILQSTRTIEFGMESLSFRGSILWNNLNDEIRSYQQLQALKQRSKHGWVKNVIAKSVNSLSITLCSRSLYLLCSLQARQLYTTMYLVRCIIVLSYI